LSKHPSREELAALARGELAPERIIPVFFHLVSPCARCLAKAPPPLGVLLGSEPPRAEPTLAESAAYDAAMDRAVRRVLAVERHLQGQREQAAQVAPLLATGGFQAMEKLPRRMGNLAKMEALLARSWELRHESPTLMVQLTTAAVWCAARLNPRRYGLQRVADFQCRARAELGNAHRVAQDLPRAAIELGFARQFYELGTRDRFLETRLIVLEASLAADRRQFALASNNLLRVQKFYLRNGDLHQVGRTLIKRGLYTGYAGDPEKALRLLSEGFSLIDEVRDPSLVYSARHNQLMFLIDLGRFREAMTFRLKHSQDFVDHLGRLNEIRFRSLEGRIDAGNKKYARAESIFREVKQGFEEVNRGYDAALISLDLAAALLAQKKAEEAQKLVETAAKVFTLLQIEREALAAVIMLRHAFEEKQATVALVEEVAAFVRRAENDPTAVFNPQRW
jgi:tetratricopeptide (TPR) repeat protein